MKEQLESVKKSPNGSEKSLVLNQWNVLFELMVFIQGSVV